MYKKISCMTLIILLTSCSSMMSESAKKDKEESDKHLGVKGMKEFETDPAVVIRETNKVKCQEARLDMVNAEANRDEGEIRLIKARLQKYCIADE